MMASIRRGKFVSKTSLNSLTYIQRITKLPEQGFKDAADYYVLPCSNTHSVLQIYNDFFTIVSILYDQPYLKMEMLDHIRSQYGYYKQSAYLILSKKKLDLADWLATMDRKIGPWVLSSFGNPPDFTMKFSRFHGH